MLMHRLRDWFRARVPFEEMDLRALSKTSMEQSSKVERDYHDNRHSCEP